MDVTAHSSHSTSMRAITRTALCYVIMHCATAPCDVTHHATTPQHVRVSTALCAVLRHVLCDCVVLRHVLRNSRLLTILRALRAPTVTAVTIRDMQ
jgi:hypothetical protein